MDDIVKGKLINWNNIPLNELIDICSKVYGAKYLLYQRNEIAAMAKLKKCKRIHIIEQLIGESNENL